MAGGAFDGMDRKTAMQAEKQVHKALSSLTIILLHKLGIQPCYMIFTTLCPLDNIKPIPSF